MIVDQYKALDEILKITKENNEILHSMKRHQRWASIFRAVYWLIIIGVSLGAYYFIQPYLESIMEAYQSITGTASKFPGLDFTSFLQ